MEYIWDRFRPSLFLAEQSNCSTLIGSNSCSVDNDDLFITDSYEEKLIKKKLTAQEFEKKNGSLESEC